MGDSYIPHSVSTCIRKEYSSSGFNSLRFWMLYLGPYHRPVYIHKIYFFTSLHEKYKWMPDSVNGFTQSCSQLRASPETPQFNLSILTISWVYRVSAYGNLWGVTVYTLGWRFVLWHIPNYRSSSGIHTTRNIWWKLLWWYVVRSRW